MDTVRYRYHTRHAGPDEVYEHGFCSPHCLDDLPCWDAECGRRHVYLMTDEEIESPVGQTIYVNWLA